MKEEPFASNVALKRPAPNRLGLAGLLVAITALAAFLIGTYSLKPYSDPAQWYRFGLSFGSRFVEKDLAYGFPLLVSIAARIVGRDLAFLVNIPVLLVLTVMLYEFSRQHVRFVLPDRPALAMAAGAAAVCIFVRIEKPMLNYLVNPYRDPFSFVLLLGSCIFLVKTRASIRHPLAPAAGAGILLALATSTRETSILVAPAFLLFAATEKLRSRSLPFWLPMAVAGIAFAVACIPMAIQNHLITGHALVPAQATASLNAGGSYLPGVRLSLVPRLLERTTVYFRDHHGPVLLAVLAGSLVLACKQRNTLVLCLSLPAAFIYFFFYAGYNKLVPRYLFVLELFVIPIMSYGLAAAFGAVSGRLGRRWNTQRVDAAAGAALFLLAAGLALHGLRAPAERFRLADMRRLRNEVAALVPSKSLVLTDRPLGGLLKCFTDLDADPLVYVSPSRTLQDPRLPGLVTDLMAERPAVYGMYTPKEIERYLHNEFDAEPLRTFRSSDYGLRDTVEADEICLARLTAWLDTGTTAVVDRVEPGDYTVTVDLGRLSKVERAHARVYVNESLADERPLDYRNFYPLAMAAPGPVTVRVESDAPVPRRIAAAIAPLEQGIHMSFRNEDFNDYAGRFSPSFVEEPGARYPGILEDGWTIIPTLQPEDAWFVVVASVGLESPLASDNRSLDIVCDQGTVFTGTVLNSSRRGGAWQRISFPLRDLPGDEQAATLQWRQGPLPPETTYGRLAINSLQVYRLLPADRLYIAFGLPSDEPYSINGLYEPEREPGRAGAHWRWTSGCASIRIPPPTSARGQARFVVRYFDASRPAALPAPKPAFFVNGVRAEPALSEETDGGRKCIAATFQGALDRPEGDLPELRIETDTWTPSEHGAQDQRSLGIMLHDVRVERL